MSKETAKLIYYCLRIIESYLWEPSEIINALGDKLDELEDILVTRNNQ